MKKLLLLLALMPNAFAQQIQVSQIETYPDYDINFKLHDSTSSNYGKLDCQSFFKKFDFFDGKDQILSENYITMSECEYIHNSIKSCIATSDVKCIDSTNIFNTSCTCED